MTVETYVTVRLEEGGSPPDVAALARRTGYTEEQVETYLWNAGFYLWNAGEMNTGVMYLPIKRDLALQKI